MAKNEENNQFIGISCGDKTTKIHVIVDALENPVEIKLISRNIHDSKLAIDMLSNINISNSTILADKAYGTNEILDYIQNKDSNYTIPSKLNSKIK